MTDPKPLLSGPVTPFERRLLETARDEVPSEELTARMLQVLGPTPIGPEASPEKAPLAPNHLIPKPFVLSLVGVGAAVVAAYFGLAPSTSSSEESAVPMRAGIEEVSRKAAAPRVPPLRLSAFRPQPGRPLPSKVPPLPEGDSLRDELRLLDQARAALRQGDEKLARTVLARYAERHPKGQLKVEAATLRSSLKN
jgi:hypothetical protein